MRFSHIAPVMALVALCGAAAAQEAAPVENKTVIENKNPTQKISCVHQDAPTGSRMGGKKVCHTEAEWATIRANSQDTFTTLQDRQALTAGMLNGH